MLDFRYHALSLAAVLLALTVGVLLGVAIGDSNLVSSAKNGIVRDLNADVSGAQAQNAKLREQLGREETLNGDLYPLAVHDVLSGDDIGLVFLGNSSEATNQLVREAVEEAGGNLTVVVSVREPLELGAIAQEATGTRYTALDTDQTLLRPFGARMGIQLLGGGALLNRIQTRLLSSFDGQFGRLDGVVIEREVPSGLTSEQMRQTDEFASGLLSGITAAGASSVGVELTSTDPSQVPWYKSERLSSVDDLNTVAGRAALAFALTGAHGAWGIKQTADALLPHGVASKFPRPLPPLGSRRARPTALPLNRHRARLGARGAARPQRGRARSAQLP